MKTKLKVVQAAGTLALLCVSPISVPGAESTATKIEGQGPVVVPEEIVQDSIDLIEGTNVFLVRWTYTEAGGKKVIAAWKADGDHYGINDEFINGWLKHRTDHRLFNNKAKAEDLVTQLRQASARATPPPGGGPSLSAPKSRAGERGRGAAEPWPSGAGDTQLLGPTRPAPLLFTFSTSAQDVIQDSISKLRMGTTQFAVKFQYTAAGSNKARAFDEAHQNQEVRYKIGEFTTPPILLRSTNTSGRNGYHGLSENDADAIVTALKRK